MWYLRMLSMLNVNGTLIVSLQNTQIYLRRDWESSKYVIMHALELLYILPVILYGTKQNVRIWIDYNKREKKNTGG